MFKWLRSFRKQESETPPPAQPRHIALTSACVKAIEKCLKENIRRRHEGICYLYGVIGEEVSLAVSAIKPEAETTFGSFFVSAKSMARVVREGANNRLQVVGQVHTHPRQAFHSEGDDEGAHIAYYGYISIVLPHYGEGLLSFNGAAFFIYVKGRGFIEVPASQVIIVPEVVA